MQGVDKSLQAPSLSQNQYSPKSPCVHPSGSSPNPLLLGFSGGSITYIYDQLNDSTSNPNPFPGGQEQEGKFQSSNHVVDSLGNLPPFLGGAQESTQ